MPPVLTTPGPQTNFTVPTDSGPLEVIAVPGQSPTAQASSIFVLRPGAVPVPNSNVSTTWAALMAAVAAAPVGPKWIEYDGTLAQCTVTAGVWNVDDCRFINSAASNQPHATLQFALGAQLTFRNIYMGQQAFFEYTAPAGSPPVVTVGAGAFQQIFMLENANITCDNANAPFISVAATGNFSLLTSLDSFFGEGTNAVLTSAVGATTTIIVTGRSTIAANALAGAGAVTTLFSGDCVSGAQTIATDTRILAGVNFVQANAGAGGAAATQTITTANIARKRAGQTRVSGSQTVTTSAAATVTFQLQRDAVNVGPAVQVQASAALTVNGSVDFVDTLPDAANHTYSIVATTSAGTITQGAGSGSIVAQEF